MRWLVIILSATILLTSCSSEQSDTHNYQQIKEITQDVLHTEESKQLIKKLLVDPEIKKEILIYGQDIQQILVKTLTDESTKKEWKKILTSPQVAENILKITEKQQKQLMKVLMKDPDYQKMMFQLLKDPMYTQFLLELINSQQHRAQIVNIIGEALQVPSIKEKLTKLIIEAEQKKPQNNESENGD